MIKEIPYYIFDDEGDSEFYSSDEEIYIDDEDLKALLIDFFGDTVPEEEIQRIIDATSNGEMTEEEFDKLIDDSQFDTRYRMWKCR